MKKKRIAQLIAVLACLALLFTTVGCKTADETATTEATAASETATEATPAASANETTPLVLSTGTLDGKFSPFFATSAYDTAVVDMTQIPLLYPDKTGAPSAGDEYPSFAYSYTQEISDDNSTSTYKIILKNDVTFSDGEPVTAKDVLFTLYTLCDPLYDGSLTFYSLDVQGLSEYRLQTSAAVADEITAILAAGFTLDDNNQMVFPASEKVTSDQQAAFWAPLPELGTQFAQEIIDAVVGGYGIDEYAATFGTDLTWASFDTPSKQAAFGMAMWALGVLDGDTMQFTDASGKIWDLNTQELTAADCWNALIKKYSYDVSAAQVEAAGDINLKDTLVSAYVDTYGKIEGGVSSISGITSGTMTCEDGVDREYVQVVINGVDPTAIYQFEIYVSPCHYYTEGFTGTLNEFGVSTNDPEFIELLKSKNGAPLGAGPYVFTEYKDNVVSYVANESFLLGSPKIKNLRYKEIAGGSELDAVLTDEVYYTDPSASMTIVNDITAGEGDYAKLAYTLVDTLGYGYIGINAQYFPEWEVRKAIASTLNTSLCLEYYGELATINYRTMTKVQWAYPENPDNLFPFDETGATAKQFFLDAGYIYDEAANIMYYPADNEKAGQQVTVKATCGMEISEHPAGAVLIESQKVLASIGVKMDIEVDQNLMGKLDTAYESGIQIWTAAWGGGAADPDMFQVWYSDPAVNKATSPAAKGLFWLYQNGSDDQKAALQELNELINAGRSTLDIEERKAIYAQALELSTSLACEVPTYQRKDMFVYNKDVINVDTLFTGDDVTPYQSPIQHIWNVELNG